MSVQLNLDVNDMVHIVQKGETLYGIAKIYKTTYQKLAEINEIAEPYTILEKQGIKVPIPRHTVKKGDTLSSIAKVYGTTYQKLAEYNEISAPYSLKIGQVLNLIQVYHEQIKLVDIDKDTFSFIDYMIYLENNEIRINGTTDENGFADRVFTNVQMAIVDVEFPYQEYFEEFDEENNNEEW
jgi:LysM repeat protein